MGGSSGGGSQNTTTQVQQIPEFEQQFAQSNQDIAASLASQPYPTYQGQLIAGFNPQQTQGMQQTQNASTAYQPYLNAAAGYTQAAAQPWNAQTAQQYMSPYAQSALQPQIEALQQQEATQQNQTNAQATQAGAYGDARQGVQTGLNNFYGNQALNNIEATGMNQAYNTGLGAYQQQQQTLGNVGTALMNEGNAATNTGIAGAQANFQAGTQQQQLQQQQLSEAYQNFLNQTNWGQNELGLRESALSGSPFNNLNYTSLAPTNASANNISAFSSLAGAAQNLLSPSGNSSSAPIGGTPISSDIRLKKNITRLGMTPKGIPLYSYNYLWDDELHIGVLAQQIEEIIPEAVIINEHGFRSVNYRRVA